MKMIKSIAATGFKIGSFDDDLSQVTVYVGNNFTGKSSRTEALTLAIAGFLPGIEKRPMNIFGRLSCANEMSVKASFDDGSFIQRSYRSNGKGGVTCKVNTRAMSENFAVDPTLVDSTLFLNMSSKARTKFLFDLLPMEGEVPTVPSLIEQVDLTQFDRQEECAKYLARLQEEMETDFEKSIPQGITPQQFLESMIVTLTDRKKVSDETARTMIASQTGMAGSGVENVKSRKDAEAEKQAAFTAIQDLNKRIDQIKDSVKLADRSEQKELANQIARLESRIAMFNEGIEKADEQIAGLKKAVCCPYCESKAKGWKDKLGKKLKKQNKDAKDEVLKASAEVEKLRKKFNALRSKLDIADEGEKLKAAAEIEKVRDIEYAETKHRYDLALEEVSKVDKREAEEKQRSKAAEKQVAAEVESSVLKSFIAIIQEAFDQVVAQSINPFIRTVNDVCGIILPHHIEYKDNELGMDRNGSFVSWKSFSGTESALFYMAVSIALAVKSEIKIAILDEMGRLDKDNRDAVFCRMLKLIEDGVIQQAILLDAGNLQEWRDREEINASVVRLYETRR